MSLSVDVLRVAQSFVLLFGVIVIFYAARGYRRSKSRSMLLLGIGFAFVSVGAVLAGVLFELLNVDLLTVQTTEAIAEAIGFFIIVYSLAVTKG